MKQKRTFQFKAVYEGALIADEKKRLEAQRDVLQRAGLEQEAKKLQKRINECVIKFKQAKEKAKQQRLVLVREMLLCFAAADLATVCCDKVSEAFDRVSYGEERKDGNAFAELFRLQAKELNKCVQLVDGECGDERVSFLYSDLAEEIIDKVMPMMYQVIDDCMASDRGKIL